MIARLKFTRTTKFLRQIWLSKRMRMCNWRSYWRLCRGKQIRRGSASRFALSASLSWKSKSAWWPTMSSTNRASRSETISTRRVWCLMEAWKKQIQSKRSPWIMRHIMCWIQQALLLRLSESVCKPSFKSKSCLCRQIVSKRDRVTPRLSKLRMKWTLKFISSRTDKSAKFYRFTFENVLIRQTNSILTL